MKKIVIICGPTASGKSQIALNIARKFDGIIINADSMQIYNEIPIITSQPTINDRKEIPHKLYGIIPGNQRFSVAKWLDIALKEIKESFSKNKTTIITGGTGLYISSLINGIKKIPDISKEQEQLTDNLLTEHGISYLYNTLKYIDPNIKINANDKSRLIRYFNLYQEHNMTPTDIANIKNELFFPREKFTVFSVMPEREALYKNCEERFISMIEQEGLNEVKLLLEKNYNDNNTIMKAISVSEIKQFLNKEISYEEMIKLSQKATRNYAKRQITWFKNQLDKDTLILNKDIDNNIQIAIETLTNSNI